MSRLPHKALVAACALLAALLLLEVMLQFSGLDMALVTEVVPRMKHHGDVHRAVADPRFLIRLTPGASASYNVPGAGFSVSVNSLGFRGAERTLAKPAGVFRIACVGASNTYGAGVDDHETWPHRLEQRLNRGGGSTRYEVWNLGVSGYNSLQLAAVAEEALARYSPDLIILSMSNRGPRHFLVSTVSLDTFRRDPTLWLETFPAPLFEVPPWPSRRVKLWLAGRVALYRLALAAALGRSDEGQSGIPREAEQRYVEHTRRFFKRALGRVKLAIHICPAVRPRHSFAPHYTGLDVPVFLHRAEGKPPDYSLIHPPPHVLVWYAEVMARWLHQHGLLGRRQP